MAGRLMQVHQQVHILGPLGHTSLPFCSAPLLSAVSWPEFKWVLSLGQRQDPRVGVQGPGVLWPSIQSRMASGQVKDNESGMAGFQNSSNGIEADAVPNVLGPWSGGEAPAVQTSWFAQRAFLHRLVWRSGRLESRQGS